MTTEELAAAVDEVRQKVRARYQKQVVDLPQLALPSLMPLLEARDAAQGKVASIGMVNPRRPGIFNSVVQAAKKFIARALDWHIREQVLFNRSALECIDRSRTIFDEHNRNLLALAGIEREHQEAIRHLKQRQDAFEASWDQWRGLWDRSEITLLRSIANLEGVIEHRLQTVHGDFSGALERTVQDVQGKLWGDLARMREQMEEGLETELRLIRQRLQMQAASPIPAAAPAGQNEGGGVPAVPVDFARFAERFRGSREHVLASHRFYLPYFEGRRRVLDVGCGRGEFLELMREAGVAACGVDSDAECAGLCRQKQLEVEQADLFQHLGGQPDASLDGIFCCQVVEHLPPFRVPELVALCARKLASGGVLAIETPNPECLAIFATNFYLDPTHVRPVPSPLLHFYMHENGFGSIEVHQLAPAAAEFREIAAMGAVEGLEGFQKKFFGGQDYAILGVKRQ